MEREARWVHRNIATKQGASKNQSAQCASVVNQVERRVDKKHLESCDIHLVHWAQKLFLHKIVHLPAGTLLDTFVLSTFTLQGFERGVELILPGALKKASERLGEHF